MHNSEVLIAYVTHGWSEDSKKFRTLFFCNILLSLEVFCPAFGPLTLKD
jgi:hypothetical protein